MLRTSGLNRAGLKKEGAQVAGIVVQLVFRAWSGFKTERNER